MDDRTRPRVKVFEANIGELETAINEFFDKNGPHCRVTAAAKIWEVPASSRGTLVRVAVFYEEIIEEKTKAA